MMSPHCPPLNEGDFHEISESRRFRRLTRLRRNLHRHVYGTVNGVQRMIEEARSEGCKMET